MSSARLQVAPPKMFSPRFQLSDLPSAAYESRFKKWDDISWVRKKPHRTTPFDRNLYYYSESIATLFAHPKVRSASEETRRKLLVLHLYTYLEFTVRLELGPVNEVSQMLSREDFLPWLPPQMKDDALKIYVDEGGHAEMSRVLMIDVEKATKVARLKLQPAFLKTLDNLVGREEPEYHSMIKLFFVIISETLITGTLVKLPKDETVQKAVRELASDHATDEGRHHAYFSEIFEYVWPRLPREMRHKIGLLLPDMIMAFLQPDAYALTLMLEQFPKEFPTPGQMVEEIIGYESTQLGILNSATPTLRMLRDHRVFVDPEIAEAFHGLGLMLR
ncbi:MAG: diiron oxygenase [Pyrinomonadaceae bacterium]